MKITLVGGSGLIGRALAEELKQFGDSVTILSRGSRPEDLHTLIKWEIWDGKDAARLKELLFKQDAVVNLAGESIGKGKWTKERKAILLQSRLESTTAIVEALTQMVIRPSVLIQASAVGYYPSGDAIMDERGPAGTDYLAQLAQAWEAASLPVEALNVRRVVIRSGVVLSKKGGVLEQLTLPFKLFVGGPIGSGKQFVPWIHIEDEVNAIRFLIHNETSRGIYNLNAPEIVRNAAMGKMIATVMKRPYWLPVPAFAMKLLLGEMSTLVLDGQHVVPLRVVKEGFSFRYYHLEPALRDLLS
ncbi:Epimerase family protein [bioreactor metagenome]|uniref:Epimerase family protein n=1 Tax=bioreactor metagenome TaxID=1076179 RepID=A0A644YUV8_9ZZZZ